MGALNAGVSDFETSENFIAAHRVRYRCNARSEDFGVAHKHGFNFDSGDVFARATDDVLFAVYEEVVAVCVDADNIACVKPATLPCVLGCRSDRKCWIGGCDGHIQ